MFKFTSNRSALGSSPEKRAKLSMIEGTAMDLRLGIALICFNPKFVSLWYLQTTFYYPQEEAKMEYLKELPRKLEMWSHFLGEKQYLTGPAVSFQSTISYNRLLNRVAIIN